MEHNIWCGLNHDIKIDKAGGEPTYIHMHRHILYISAHFSSLGYFSLARGIASKISRVHIFIKLVLEEKQKNTSNPQTKTLLLY